MAICRRSSKGTSTGLSNRAVLSATGSMASLPPRATGLARTRSHHVETAIPAAFLRRREANLTA
eukprot:scaffold149_cov315-Pinguiococcus_pyrenoidosus.AAC.96